MPGTMTRYSYPRTESPGCDPEQNHAAGPLRMEAWVSPLWQRRIGITALILLVLVTNMGRLLIDLPMRRIIKFNYCKHWYEQHAQEAFPSNGQFSESMCQIDEVERRSAELHRRMSSASLAINLVMALPYSFLANRNGPMVTLFLNLAAFIFSCIYTILVLRVEDFLPTGAELAAPFFLILGGGELIWTGTSFAVASKLADTEVKRLYYVAYADAAISLTSLVLPGLSQESFTRDPWYSVWIGLGLLFLALPFLGILSISVYLIQHDYGRRVSGIFEEDPLLPCPANPTGPSIISIKGPFSHVFSELRSDFNHLSQLILRQRNFRALLEVMFCVGLASPAMTSLGKYLTERYGWSESRAINLLLGRAGTVFVLNVILGPLIVDYFERQAAGPPAELQVLAAKVCLLASSIGEIAIGLSHVSASIIISTIVSAVGPVVSIYTLSLASSPSFLVYKESKLIQMYSMVFLARALGFVGGKHLLNALWHYGLQIGGFALGLPYLVSAVFPLIAASILWPLRI